MLDPTVLILANGTSKSLALGDVKSRVRQHVAPGCSYPNLGWHSEGDKLHAFWSCQALYKRHGKDPWKEIEKRRCKGYLKKADSKI